MKVAICSLGCKVNLYEGEYVSELLEKAGFEIVDFNTTADIYIINTCSVTNEADKKSRKMIHRVKREHEEAIIVVMGCYSQVKPEDIEADIVIGNKNKSDIVNLIQEVIATRKKITEITNLREETAFETMEITNFDNHTRAFVKIQDGCNAFCSYCIIPYTRGRLRSKQMSDVISEVTNLVSNGYQEIVLTGIHTGKYGQDLKNTSLEQLLNQLIKIKGLYKIRLSSIEINEITPGILDILKNSNIIADHLHIPLQSGCDRILKLMNRKYTVKEYIDKVEEIRKLKPNISLTTDLIVGFPTETDTDFEETLKTLNLLKFTKIHTFPYSARANTPASLMKQVDGNVKKQRVNKILKLSEAYEHAYYLNNLKNTLEGISEVRKDGTVVILTSNYITVLADKKIANNTIVKVKIEEVDESNNVFGRIV